MERGAVTFTDELGEYMTVKDFTSVVFAGEQFTKKTAETSEDGKTTAYTFEGEVAGNPIYGTANLADLVVTVTHGEQTDTVSVQVPEQLLPLRLYSATVDQNGAVSTTINDTFPIRVFYSVALKDGVEEALANPDEALAAYIAANGETFTSNKYEANAELGSTTAAFTPAKSNDFYYFVNDTPLYNTENTTCARIMRTTRSTSSGSPSAALTRTARRRPVRTATSTCRPAPCAWASRTTPSRRSPM